MKRVLQFIETTGPGGAETVFLSLLQGLGEQKEWAAIPLVTGPGWLKTQIQNRGFSPFELNTAGPFDFRFLAGIRSLIKDQAVDLVHAHLQGAVVYGSLAASLAKVPTVATFHGFPDLELAGRAGWLKAQFLKRSGTTFVFVSEALREAAVGSKFVPRDRTEVIENGIDLNEFKAGPTGGDSDRPTGEGRSSGQGISFLVGAVGNVRPAKDYANLLSTAAYLKEKAPGRFRFSVCGQKTDPLYSSLIAQRDSLGLGESDFDFRGFCGNIPEFLQEIDCLAISSSSEGFSLATIQAMASGAPVVATRCGGPETIIDDGVNGLLVAKDDPGALGEGLLRLMDSQTLRKNLIGAAQERVVERYSLSAMLSQYQRVYEAAMGAHKHSSSAFPESP